MHRPPIFWKTSGREWEWVWYVCVNVSVYILMSIYMSLCILHIGSSVVITLKYLLYEPWSDWRQAHSKSVKNPCPLTLQTLLMEDSLPGWQLPPLVYQWGLALKPEPLWPFGSNPLPSAAEQTMTIEGDGRACDLQVFTDKSVKSCQIDGVILLSFWQIYKRQ